MKLMHVLASLALLSTIACYTVYLPVDDYYGGGCGGFLYFDYDKFPEYIKMLRNPIDIGNAGKIKYPGGYYLSALKIYGNCEVILYKGLNFDGDSLFIKANGLTEFKKV